MRRARRLAAFAAAVLAVPAAAAGGEAFEGPEKLIATVERAEPLDTAKLHAVFGADLRCGAQGCERGPMVLRGLPIARLDFRHGGFGSLLIDEGLQGQCLILDRVRTLYPGGAVTQACTDGALCFYYAVRRPWGKLSIGLPKSFHAQDCATSVIFGTMD